MNEPNTSLTKICGNCGLRKPLSAFLQISSSHGYGNICSACRKTVLENPVQDAEESTRSTTGAKLDAKAKVKEVADKRKAFQQSEEDYFKERDKKEHKKIERSEKIIQVADKAKKHHGLWEKRSPETTRIASKTPVFGGADHIAAAGKVDFSHGGPIETTRVAGQVKTAQSSVYQSFKTWLGNAAPIVSAAERAAKQKHPGKTAPGAPKTGPDAVSEFTHQNSGPKTKR